MYHNQPGPTTPPTSSTIPTSSPTPTSSSTQGAPAAPQQPNPYPYPHPHPQPAPAPAPVHSSPAPPPAAPNPPSTPAPAPAPSPSPSHSTPASPPPSPSPPKPAPAPSQPAPAPAPSHPSSPPAGGPGFGSAISYSPYNADNTCKSTSQVASDLAKVTGYEVIRLYGTDCNQIANVLSAVKGKGVSLFLGIFDIHQVQSESQTLIDAVKGDWSVVNTVSVGNELVNNGGASVGQVTGAIGQARGILRGAGYNGPVVTVDTMVAMKNNPALCTASDFCAINCHAFFDGKTPADQSGPFVANWAKMVSEAAGGKTVVVTETGWPSQGYEPHFTIPSSQNMIITDYHSRQTNGLAVPSQENQQAAVASIKQHFATNAILYSSFNNMWKKDSASTFGAERYWGILGPAPSG
jgi:exo-beta-1,3-glucanase (GH17 family)